LASMGIDMQMGRSEKAVAALQALAARARARGSVLGAATAEAQRALLLLQITAQQQPDAALQSLLDRLETHLGKATSVAIMAASAHARAALNAGNAAKALAIIERAESGYGAPLPTTSWAIDHTLLKVRVQIAMGLAQPAVDSAKFALEQAQASAIIKSASLQIARVRVALAEALIASGKADAAAAELSDATRHLLATADKTHPLAAQIVALQTRLGVTPSF
jgi:tetratricopeptide (TPR) repeat protein